MPWGRLRKRPPKKGGCMASAPTLDLTTSLRGDFPREKMKFIKGALSGSPGGALRIPHWGPCQVQPPCRLYLRPPPPQQALGAAPPTCSTEAAWGSDIAYFLSALATGPLAVLGSLFFSAGDASFSFSFSFSFAFSCGSASAHQRPFGVQGPHTTRPPFDGQSAHPSTRGGVPPQKGELVRTSGSTNRCTPFSLYGTPPQNTPPPVRPTPRFPHPLRHPLYTTASVEISSKGDRVQTIGPGLLFRQIRCPPLRRVHA